MKLSQFPLDGSVGFSMLRRLQERTNISTGLRTMK